MQNKPTVLNLIEQRAPPPPPPLLLLLKARVREKEDTHVGDRQCALPDRSASLLDSFRREMAVGLLNPFLSTSDGAVH